MRNLVAAAIPATSTPTTTSPPPTAVMRPLRATSAIVGSETFQVGAQLGTDISSPFWSRTSTLSFSDSPSK